MIRSLSRLCFVAIAAATMWGAPAHAFTLEGGEGNEGTTPKFDIEEQARNFQTPRMDLSTPGMQKYDTPYGTFHFGAGAQTGSMLNSPMGFGPRSDSTDRRHYDRMFDPQMHLYNTR